MVDAAPPVDKVQDRSKEVLVIAEDVTPLGATGQVIKVPVSGLVVL